MNALHSFGPTLSDSSAAVMKELLVEAESRRINMAKNAANDATNNTENKKSKLSGNNGGIGICINE